jgi:putative oxidoreductase
MYLLDKIDAWADRHHPKWLDVLRALLGLILLWKGIFFIRNTQLIVQMLQNTTLEFLAAAIAHFVAGAHIMGGILIILGLLTRVAILFQIPILLGAIIFVNIPRTLSAYSSELELSILVLFLLVFFLIEGSGPISIDNYLSKHKDGEY